jgi:hypothetical protein
MKTRFWSRALLVLAITQFLFLFVNVAWSFPFPPPSGCDLVWWSDNVEYCQTSEARDACLYGTCREGSGADYAAFQMFWSYGCQCSCCNWPD